MKQTLDIKGKTIGKYLILENPFSIKGRRHCKVECMWCHKVFTTKLQNIKKNLGCFCKEKNKIDVGMKFGELTVLEIVSYTQIKCKCSCGSIKDYRRNNLYSGNTKNCGCVRKKRVSKMSTKHSLSKTRIYRLYLSMKARCYRKSVYAYKWYGEKGIKVCDEWLGENGFMNFYNWAMSNGYEDKLSLERKDVNSNYCPENCTWIELLKQHENTSHSLRVKTKEGYVSVKTLSKKYNIPIHTLYSRIRLLDKKNLTEELVVEKFGKRRTEPHILLERR